MTRPRTHYLRGEARRTLLLDAAVEVIAEHGLEGVTHRAIARAADVPLSTTSYFFGSLDELVGAAVTRIADGVLAALDALIVDAAALVGSGHSVEEYVDQLVEVIAAPRERQLLVQFEAYLGTTRRPELTESVRRIVTAYERAAETALAALGVEDPRPLARHLVALLDGFALQRIAHPRDDDQEMLRRAVRSLARAHVSP